ncbi:hypothetical protein MTO96_015904 [Rhipicephalus appendiculatus]
MFPPDALCDCTFCDSLYEGYTDLLQATSDFNASLSAFVDAYATYQTMAFGIAYKYALNTEEMERTAATSPAQEQQNEDN